MPAVNALASLPICAGSSEHVLLDNAISTIEQGRVGPADQGVASLIPARSHTFMEIDHEIISTAILLPSAESFKKSCCQLQVCARSTALNCSFKLTQEKVWLGELTVPP